jgi:hypothetical protein
MDGLGLTLFQPHFWIGKYCHIFDDLKIIFSQERLNGYALHFIWLLRLDSYPYLCLVAR